MKAGELVKKMQALYPHIPMRLSREGDPELSTVLIHFFPKAMRPKKNKPPERSGKNSPDKQPQANKPKEIRKKRR